MSFDAGSSAAVDADAALRRRRGENGATVSAASVKTLAAGTLVTAKHRCSTGAGTWIHRWMMLVPVS
jgi:hypothetical protein